MNNLLSFTNQTNTNNAIQSTTGSTNKIEDLLDLLNITKPTENLTNTTNTNNNNNINHLDMMNLINSNLINPNNNLINNNPILLNQSKYHEFFKNDEVSFCFTLYKSFDGSMNSAFYMSNLKPKQLTNVKINFSVQKFVNLKVLSTSGNTLNPMEIRGIKKVIN